MKYLKKAMLVDALQWQGGDYACLDRFCGKNWGRADAKDVDGPDDIEHVVIWNTHEKQWLNLPVGHWVIRGIDGELYPCEPSVFFRSYEPADTTEGGREP